MSAFRELRDCCISFEEDLERQAATLFSAHVQNVTEAIEQKCQDIPLYTSKFHLLHAKLKAMSPQVTERVQNGVDVRKDYEETVEARIIEAAVVRSMTQGHAVKKLLTTPDDKLNVYEMERKKLLVDHYNRLTELESELRIAERMDHEEADEELHAAMEEWDAELGELRQQIAAAVPTAGVDTASPHYRKLKQLIGKMELMRSLISKLIIGKTGYDWLNDPDGIIKVLALTREENTMERYLDMVS